MDRFIKPLYVLFRSYLLHNTSTKQTLIKNTFWLISGEIIAKALVFFVTVWIARYLEVINYGKFSFAFTFSAFFGILIDFGLNTLTIREVSRNTSLAKKYINNIIPIKILLAFLTFFLIYFLIEILGKTDEVKALVYSAGVYTVLQSFVLYFQSVFQAYEKMQYVFISRLASSFSLIILIFYTVQNNKGINMIANAHVLSLILTLLTVLYMTSKFFTNFSIEFDLKFIKKIILSALPFVLSSGAVMIYYRIDSILLSILDNDKSVGFYNAAYNVIILMITIISLVTNALLPPLSKIYIENKDKFSKIVLEASELVVLASIPLIGSVFFNAELIINIIYGQSFRSVTPLILQILVWSVLLLYSYSIVGLALIASNKQNEYLKIVLLAAVLNVLANIILIPKFNYIGASVTTVLTELFLCISMYKIFIVENKVKFQAIEFMKLITIGTSFFIIVYIFSNVFDLNNILSTILGFFSYIMLSKLFNIRMLSVKRIFIK